MEDAILKFPFFVATQCQHCGNKNRLDLQAVPWKGKDSFKYQCLHCKQTNDLFDDENFVALAEMLVDHRSEVVDWMHQGLAEMALQMLEKGELDLDEETIRALRQLPKEKFREGIMSLMLGETPKIE